MAKLIFGTLALFIAWAVTTFFGLLYPRHYKLEIPWIYANNWILALPLFWTVLGLARVPFNSKWKKAILMCAGSVMIGIALLMPIWFAHETIEFFQPSSDLVDSTAKRSKLQKHLGDEVIVSASGLMIYAKKNEMLVKTRLKEASAGYDK